MNVWPLIEATEGVYVEIMFRAHKMFYCRVLAMDSGFHGSEAYWWYYPNAGSVDPKPLGFDIDNKSRGHAAEREWDWGKELRL